MSTLNTSDTTPCYGAAIRIEFSDYQQGYGGTLNMYDGAVIKNVIAECYCHDFIIIKKSETRTEKHVKRWGS